MPGYKLENANDSSLEHVRLNFSWTACSSPQHWPYDWSSKLMATALAMHPWKDGNWKHMLSLEESGGFDQFGELHGEIFLTDKHTTNYEKIINGILPDIKIIRVHLSGLRSRRWGPSKVSHLHRTATLVGVLKNGTLFELGAMSSKQGLSQ